MTVLALVHTQPLVAKELREELERRREVWSKLRLYSTLDDEIGTLTETRGSAAMVLPLTADALDDVDVVFFCGPLAANREAIARLGEAGGATRAIVLSPDAGVELGQPIVAAINLQHADRDDVLVSPHPGVVALAHLLHPLRRLGVESAVATLLQPASVHSSAALDEVLEQARSILRFETATAREIFGAQLVFNLLPVADPGEPLVAQLRDVLAGDGDGDDEPVGELGLQVLQAGVFHGLAISLRVRLRDDPGSADAVREALGGHPMNELASDPAILGPIDTAQSDRLMVGPVTGGDGVYWIWAVADNLTLGGAHNALAIFEAIAGAATTH